MAHITGLILQVCSTSALKIIMTYSTHFSEFLELFFLLIIVKNPKSLSMVKSLIVTEWVRNGIHKFLDKFCDLFTLIVSKQKPYQSKRKYGC